MRVRMQPSIVYACTRNSVARAVATDATVQAFDINMWSGIERAQVGGSVGMPPPKKIRILGLMRSLVLRFET